MGRGVLSKPDALCLGRARAAPFPTSCPRGGGPDRVPEGHHSAPAAACLRPAEQRSQNVSSAETPLREVGGLDSTYPSSHALQRQEAMWHIKRSHPELCMTSLGDRSLGTAPDTHWWRQRKTEQAEANRPFAPWPCSRPASPFQQPRRSNTPPSLGPHARSALRRALSTSRARPPPAAKPEVVPAAPVFSVPQSCAFFLSGLGPTR